MSEESIYANQTFGQKTGFGQSAALLVVVYADDGADAGIWCRKVPRLRELTKAASASQVVNLLAPRTGEPIVRKT